GAGWSLTAGPFGSTSVVGPYATAPPTRQRCPAMWDADRSVAHRAATAWRFRPAMWDVASGGVRHLSTVPPMGILRLSHVDITVPDLDLARAYYTGVMGMEVTADTGDRTFFKCWDEEDHHSLAVRYDPRVGMDRFA